MRKLKNKGQTVLHVNPSALSFSLFTRDEVQKLSEVKITTPLSFNALGHPLKGGLYDPALGMYISENGEREFTDNLGLTDFEITT
jgi:hypothetical protein